MKSVRELIHLQTAEKEEILNITQRVMEIVSGSGIGEGMALVYPMHTSSAVYVSDTGQGGNICHLEQRIGDRFHKQHRRPRLPTDRLDSSQVGYVSQVNRDSLRGQELGEQSKSRPVHVPGHDGRAA